MIVSLSWIKLSNNFIAYRAIIKFIDGTYHRPSRKIYTSDYNFHLPPFNFQNYFNYCNHHRPRRLKKYKIDKQRVNICSRIMTTNQFKNDQRYEYIEGSRFNDDSKNYFTSLIYQNRILIRNKQASTKHFKYQNKSFSLSSLNTFSTITKIRRNIRK